MKLKCLAITALFLVLCSLSSELKGQGAEDEVYLQFRHEGSVNVYLSSIYFNNDFFISVSDLFIPLEIDLKVDRAQFTLSGNYLGKGPYNINLTSQKARFQDINLNLSVEDFIITELGYYLKADILKRLFGIDIIVNFNSLTMTIESEDTMPVVSRRERELQRSRALRNQSIIRQDFYPLLFDRESHFLNGGFIDYNLTANLSNTGSNNYLFNNRIGTEFLYGEVQGNIFGSISQDNSIVRTNNLRWRYGIRDKDWISTVTLGQSSSRGLRPVAYSGLSISNSPIEPRIIYDETTLSGVADPNSEVEVYRNNSIIDFMRANEAGEYSFQIPITYGSMTYRIETYSPTGEQDTRELRLQIPQNFLPPGEINYTLNAGIMDNPIIGSDSQSKMAVMRTDYGINEKLSFSTGIEYFDDYHESLPTFSGRLSTRLFQSYLFSVEAANDAFYRTTGNVVFPNNTSLRADYTYFTTDDGIYNRLGVESTLSVNAFTPIELGPVPLYFRWNVSNDKNDNTSITRYRFNLNTRVGRANIRMGFNDSQTGKLDFKTSMTAQLTGSISYSTPRGNNLPSLLRGIFFRAQSNYFLESKSLQDVQFSLSRNITRRGQFQFIGTHNFARNFSIFRVAFSFDFDKFRTRNNLRFNEDNYSLSSGVRGSLGYDINSNNLLFSNRQQVARSAVAVKMFVDDNDSGTYDEGEEIIPQNAARIERAGAIYQSKNGISYISQLQSYRRYNMTINKGLINNPLLVPNYERFSFVADPNQYKSIEIPFYMSGLIDGIVYREAEGGSRSGIGGLRLYLKQINVPEGKNGFQEEILTFSNGGFYSYEIPPGDYELTPDPQQLEFLNRVSVPEKLEFTIEATSMGDFVEGLEMTLVSLGGNSESDSLEASENGIRNDEVLEVSSGDKELNNSDVKTDSVSVIDNRSDEVEEETEDTEEIVDPVSPADSVNSPETGTGYVIQFGAFSEEETANGFRNELNETLGLNTFVTFVESQGLYKVQMGYFETIDDAIERGEELSEESLIKDYTIVID